MMTNYNRIGRNYDATRRADPYLVSRLAHHLVINPHGSYLDAAYGTGNYTRALAERNGGAWHGVDISEQMIETARRKSDAVEWHLEDAASLPFAAEFFDGAISTLAIHHFESLSGVFGEIRRVLKLNGAFVIFTATPEQTKNYWLAEYFPMAIEKSAAALPDLKTISNTLSGVGFESIETESYTVREDLQDLFLYSGKHKPEIYLNESVRANISTFALLADASEVETGCGRLSADIESRKIWEIMERHRQTDDYLFVVAKSKKPGEMTR